MKQLKDETRRLGVPAALVPTQPGDAFEARLGPDKDAIAMRPTAPEADWLEVLGQCPVHIDDLPSRKREYFRSKL